MKKALITGASGGIGSAMAKAFASDGFEIGICYKSSFNEARRIAAEIKEAGGRAQIYMADLSLMGDAENLCQQVLSTMGTPDVVICNAGIDSWGLFQDIGEAEWNRVLDTNLKGSYAVTRGLLPKMIERKSGVLLYTSSIWGVVGGACEAAYSASKGALISMTKALAKELGPSGIRVNCIAPGLIKTKMIDIFDSETIDGLIENTPLGRIGLPEDVADAALFLASDRASFITGQTLVVDGGIAL